LTLLQLNRHIDDTHQELPEEEQDEVKTWFDKQVLKAKRFQPLSLINQKLRGLDVFESNESAPLPPPSVVASASKAAPIEAPLDPDELITRNHWQRSTTHDLCTEPSCGKGLGPINGSINCRKCGRLFCEEHTMYQMKLSKSANHDPVRGYWVRVCETCYKSRDGYNDHNGVLIDHTDMFANTRRKKVERQNLEVSRLEKRLTKLTRLLADHPEDLSSSNGLLPQVTSWAGQKDPRKAIEQSIVTWEDDSTVPRCPFCQQEFGSWTFRRHHCRICGRVICADPQTGCSSEVGLSIASCKSTPLPLSKTCQPHHRCRRARDG
jgi:rabenosyn-5